jgi:lipopolysaccharide export system permease protein
MARRQLNRYIVSEILPPFFLGLLALTFILLVARILKLIELVIARGVPVADIAKLFALLLPTFLEIALPVAFLLGTLLALGRLSGDRETLALKASGISPLQILLPVGFLAAIVSVLTLALTGWIRPAANAALKRDLYQIARSRVEASLRENVFNSDFPDVLIYVEEAAQIGNAFQGVVVVDRRDSARTHVIFGRVAFFLPDEEAQTLGLKIFDGTLHERRKGRSGFSQTRFNVYDFRLDLEEAFSLIRKKGREPKEMSLRRLARTIDNKRELGQPATSELLELHQRLAFAVAPVVFGVLAVGLAMGPGKAGSGRLWGLVAALFWLLAYYVLFSLGKALGGRQLLAPSLAVWMPNVVIGLISLYLVRSALRELPPITAAAVRALEALYPTRPAKPESHHAR